MEFVYFLVTFLLFLLMLRLLQAYCRFKVKTSGFKFYDIATYLLYCHIKGKITKDTPTINVMFERLVELGKRCWKEGFFMTYGEQPVFFIYSEEAIKVFANEKAAIDKAPEYIYFSEAMKGGLILSSGDRWKKHRKLINPAFHMGMLKEKVPLFNKHALNLVTDMETLVGKPSVELLDHLKFHYFTVVCESVLGLEQDTKYRSTILEFCEAVDYQAAMATKKGVYPWLRLKFMLPFFPSGREYIRRNKLSDHFVENIISSMQKFVLSNNNTEEKHFKSHLRKSFTYILLNQYLHDPTFTLDDIRGEVRTIIIAGYDTVTVSTMWCLYLLGLHPEIQEKVYNEIQGTTSNHVTYEESVNLTYLEAVIMESLRIYPTVPIFLRNLTDDVMCGKHKIYKGTSIAFFPYLSNRNPEIYPDPEEFKPERFLNNETKKASSFVPFSEGRRSCIGKMFARIEMKIFLSHIIRNFKITSLDRREDLKLCWRVDLLPVNRLRYKIERRENMSS